MQALFRSAEAWLSQVGQEFKLDYIESGHLHEVGTGNIYILFYAIITSCILGQNPIF